MWYYKDISLNVDKVCHCAGLEKFGLEEFEEKKYWKSELYIDNGKKIHNALALTKVGWGGTLMMLFANKSVKAAAEKTKDTPGNYQGDGRCVIIFAPSNFHCNISDA